MLTRAHSQRQLQLVGDVPAAVLEVAVDFLASEDTFLLRRVCKSVRRAVDAVLQRRAKRSQLGQLLVGCRFDSYEGMREVPGASSVRMGVRPFLSYVPLEAPSLPSSVWRAHFFENAYPNGTFAANSYHPLTAAYKCNEWQHRFKYGLLDTMQRCVEEVATWGPDDTRR
jgi:hypothetical protein